MSRFWTSVGENVRRSDIGFVTQCPDLSLTYLCPISYAQCPEGHHRGAVAGAPRRPHTPGGTGSGDTGRHRTTVTHPRICGRE